MASLSGYRKIVLKGDFGQHEEGPLLAIASPGMNLVMDVTAETQQRQSYTPGSTDYVGTGTGITTTKGPIKILKEDSLQGKTVDDAYAIGDNAFIYIPQPGDVLQVLAASGETIVKSSGMSAAATGKWAIDATNASVECMESSVGALAADTLVRVRVL